MRQKTFC
jgi:hypothetical protein